MELVPTRKLQLLTGRTHPALAADIAAHLGVELVDANLVDFANGEVRPGFRRPCGEPTSSSFSRTGPRPGGPSTTRSSSIGS